jgi:hypothetical protein
MYKIYNHSESEMITLGVYCEIIVNGLKNCLQNQTMSPMDILKSISA